MSAAGLFAVTAIAFGIAVVGGAILSFGKNLVRDRPRTGISVTIAGLLVMGASSLVAYRGVAARLPVEGFAALIAVPLLVPYGLLVWGTWLDITRPRRLASYRRIRENVEKGNYD